MVLMQWLERGLGQIVAPDDHYTPKPDDVDTRSSFWRTVAPDPRFSDPTEHGSASSRVPPSSAFRTMSFPTEIKCEHCGKYTSTITSADDTNTTESHLLFTPSPTAMIYSPPAHQFHDPDLERRVLHACKDMARTVVMPTAARDKIKTVFRYCSGATPINDKIQNKLRKAVSKRPALLQARSFNTGNHLENGLTLFQAAASNNQVAAIQILWELGTVDLLHQVDFQGRTAFHLAALKGHTEVIDYLLQLYSENNLSPPVDLIGHTPLGTAMTSPDPKARRQKGAIMQKLFAPDDVSILGSPAPVWQRTTASSRLRLVFGTADMPGKRILHEDAILTTFLNDIAIFGVFDGHGDNGMVSSFVASQIPSALQQVMQKDGNWTTWCTETCLNVDASLKQDGVEGGSTGVFAMVTDEKIVVANVGDSRCILVQTTDAPKANVVSEDENESAEPSQEDKASPVVREPQGAQKRVTVTALSEDHKPQSGSERSRVEKAGLSVIEERFQENDQEVVIHKVQLSESNRLACSRSFGDFEYKANSTLGPEEQAIVAVPDVVIHHRTWTDSYLVLACDGVWDVMSNDEVARFVVENVEECAESDAVLPTVGDQLLAECLNRGSGDNMSVVIVALSKATEKLSVGKLEGKALDFEGSSS